jgi:N-methylhydantoinase A/oxoprolinase/acetone carboxylase beta subunit
VLRVGVDTGGTFTDFVVLDESGLRVHKVRSTPDDPSRAILQGLREVLGAGAPSSDGPATGPVVLDVVHGSTVATNALLERRGASVALVATAGFEDVLRIGRQTRRELYNFFVEAQRPLVDPALTFAVPERIAADGSVLQRLREEDVAPLAARCAAAGVESVAICFLHAYANDAHESLAADILERAGFFVSASSRVLPEYREFERWSTTVVNAYVTPIMSGYLRRLSEQLGSTPLRVMQSNGGSISAARARIQAVQTILSGPAAGAVGAHAVATAAGFPRAIGFDMGGTSTDVTLIDGALGTTTESAVGDFPVRLPMIDIETVGAGGGSIAFVDTGGALRVGPRSAGADPGPACYGTGTDLTVTDADLLLGRLDPDDFLGGRMTLDRDRARRAAAGLGRVLALEPLALADGVVRIANANMERAIRVVSVQRGLDPRDFALVAFGGAGGMHACAIADALEIGTVLVPRHAGVLSALGMLVADVTRDYSHTVLRPVTPGIEAWIEDRFAPMERQARADLQGEGFGAARIRVARAVDVRYAGQSHEITVPFAAGFRAEFDRRHHQLYGYANPARVAEIVSLRLTASGLTDKPEIVSQPAAASAPPSAARTAESWFDGRVHATPVHRLESLAPGVAGCGPALVPSAFATVVVPPHYDFRIDAFGNLVATRRASPARSRVRRTTGRTRSA